MLIDRTFGAADESNGVAMKDGAAAGSTVAAEVFIANCHLEGHPWKAQERFNQIKGVLTRIERRQSEAGAPTDDARILVVGTSYQVFLSSRICSIHFYGCLQPHQAYEFRATVDLKLWLTRSGDVLQEISIVLAVKLYTATSSGVA